MLRVVIDITHLDIQVELGNNRTDHGAERATQIMVQGHTPCVGSPCGRLPAKYLIEIVQHITIHNLHLSLRTENGRAEGYSALPLEELLAVLGFLDALDDLLGGDHFMSQELKVRKG